jgi:sporulation protein YlmC with PRC-barrel domain
MRLEIGDRVRCTDGVYGELADIVIDPLEKRVTHLVVRPAQDEGEARLVPIRLAKGTDSRQREIELECTVDEAQELESVHRAAYVRVGESPAEDPDWDVGVEDVLAMPYSGAGDIAGYDAEYDENVSITYDRVPKGEVEIRRSSPVTSSDGKHLGHVDGFVVGDDEQITHLVLERGHLWRKRDVTIPIGAVSKVETDNVELSLTADQVGELPAVRVHRRRG